MIDGLGALLFLLGGGIFAMLLQHLCKPSPKEQRIALRVALFFGWSSLSSSLLIGAWLTSWDALPWPPLDAILTPALFFWPAPFAVLRLKNKRALAWGISLIWCFGLFFVEWILGVISSPLVLASLLLRVGASAWLAMAMTIQRWPAVRSVLHGISFFSALLLLLPLGFFGALHEPLPTLSMSPPRAVFTALLGFLSLFLGVWAARALIGAGGTPDPLDPPTTLASGGPYRYLRHPLQLVEVLAVWMLALVGWHPWLTIYAVAFTILLLGPMRLLEEDGLARRFGEKATQYRQRTSAFWPW